MGVCIIMRSFLKKFRNSKSKHKSLTKSENKEVTKHSKLETKIEDNIKNVIKALGNSDDIIYREIQIGKDKNVKIGIIYTDGLIDSKASQNFILETLMVDFSQTDFDKVRFENIPLYFKENMLTVVDISDIKDYTSLFESLLSGHLILLFDGFPVGFSIGMKGGKERSVSEPTSENTIRGPKEALTENIRTNTAMIRRRINNPNLWLETIKIGTQTKTTVSFMYIKGIASNKLVEEVRIRLDRINIDSILDSAYIEELIQDKTYTPFPTIYNTERPDVVAANLLEGRVAILVDGTPFVLLAPAMFIQFLHAPDDYYSRSDIATLIRILRLVGIFIATLGPSLYIAITTFHQEMLPTPLLLSLAAQREGVPFPAFIEAIMMEITFEILRESGLRLPKAIGQAVSIVGTLVIGTAAVEAGFVSAAMVIVVSITAISSFIISSYNLSISIRMLRFPFIGLAASLGLFGIVVGIIALTFHLCSLRSFGIPYMSPFAPFVKKDQKDAIFRFPRWALFSRPRLISQNNNQRENTPAPKPPDSN